MVTKENHLEQPLNKIIQPVLPQFDAVVTSYALLNTAFIVAFTLEIVTLLFFFTFLLKSALLAFGLALLFLTVFSYLIFRLYFTAAKPQRFLEIKNQFLDSYKTLSNYQEGTASHHMALANACCRLSDSLTGKEYTFYPLPTWLKSLKPRVELLSWWWHWQDVHKMKELLLNVSIQEHIKLVHLEPTSLEIHAALANAYVLLSTHYTTPIKREEGWKQRWLMEKDAYIQSLEKKFCATSEKAIEEFKIISDYAPNDPWVHLQLAYSYRDLNMPKEEIGEYETILRLNPEDKEALFKLGSLYFKMGMNAKGLRIYEELKQSNSKKAESLLKLYGA